MSFGKNAKVSFSINGGETFGEVVKWTSIGDLHTKAFTINLEDNNMNKHPHDELIRKWLDNYDTHVVISDVSLGAGNWQEIGKPAFLATCQYKVIPRKHLDVALAFYNDGVEVQARQACSELWVTLSSEPMWDYFKYRIKPKPEPKDGEWWMCELPTGDIKCLRYWLRDGDSDGVWNIFQDESMSLHLGATVKPLHKMVQADE